MSNMRVGLGILIVALLIGIFVKIGLPVILKRQIPYALLNGCTDCTAGLESVEFQFLPLTLTFNQFQYGAGNADATRVEMQIQQIVIRLSRIEMYGPHFTVIEGDLRSPVNRDPNPGSGLRVTAAFVKTIEIKDGLLIYNRNFKNRKPATLRLRNISGKIVVESEAINSLIKGDLEKSGAFAVGLNLPRTLSNIDLDVDIKIFHQNLIDVNPYFFPSLGVHVGGTLHEAHAAAKIRGSMSLDGWVRLKYLGLDVQFEKTLERSLFEAFLSNVTKSFGMQVKTVGHPQAEQRRAFRLQRTPDETVLHFIFRGLAQAALEIIF